VVDYLLGKITDQQLRETASRARDWSGSCNVLFTAWWKAQISKNSARAAEYRDLMAKVEQDRCDSQLALVRLRAGA
jgi:hypothetical protein